MTQSIILPGEDSGDKFLYASLLDLELKCEIAMVKIPASMHEAHSSKENAIMFSLRNPTTVKTDEMNFTRYEFHTSVVNPDEVEGMDPKEFDSVKDGYVFLPKTLRDGRHSEFYVLKPYEESKFTFRVENGMYEEVYWSPFGDERGALRQEETNAKINPQMRRYNADGYDNPDFS